MPGPAYNPELQCMVVRLSYDFQSLAGRLDMAEDHCCDMSGCINVSKRLDEHVQRIDTFAAGTARYFLRAR